MGLFGRALISIALVLGLAIDIYKLAILAAVLMSWIRPDPYNPLVRFVNQITEPVFSWLRARLPQALFSTGIDLTPMIVFFILVFLESFIVGSLADAGHRMVFESRITSGSVLPLQGVDAGQANPVFEYK